MNNHRTGTPLRAATALSLLALTLTGCGAANALTKGITSTATAAVTTLSTTANAAGATVGLGNSGPATDKGGFNRYNPLTGQWNY